jgi:hypothetical protein
MARPFEKGDPRINRKGRPKKGAALTDILNNKLDMVHKTGKIKREAIAEKLIEAALNGDLAALKYVFDRVDGRPKESIELTDGAIDTRLREIMSNGK